MALHDGDGNPEAIAEMNAIAALGGDYAKAVGALIKRRQQALQRDQLDDRFEHDWRNDDSVLYTLNFCSGTVGITAAFSCRDDLLRLRSVVAFDNFIDEAKSGSALNEALRRADRRT